MNKLFAFLLTMLLLGCKGEVQEKQPPENEASPSIALNYAKGFRVSSGANGLKIIEVFSPWVNAEKAFTYALVPRENLPFITLDAAAYDAVIGIPVERLVVTSTTHIPALEALGVEEKLVGFPSTHFISSPNTRQRIDRGWVKELGNNESINTELLMDLAPDVVVGFGIDHSNKAYKTVERSKIPVVYNGDWTEETPLGKAEWLKFFAPFFNAEQKADSIFRTIEASYQAARRLALAASEKPTVLSGGLYKDVWHVAGGRSWMAQFIKDANADYLWRDTENTGSISLSLESVLAKAQSADFWINPSSLTTYAEMKVANRHYTQFQAFRQKKVFTNASVKGDTGGLVFYEFAPNRPDLVLQDLIKIFHPQLMPDHEFFFFKPLE